jgi:ABC-type dipeptide/oligopeptide/nickel transport system ATPase component
VGELVEAAHTAKIYVALQHRYTKALFAVVPSANY